MNFAQNTSIVYPFTAYYHGYLADLGDSPSLNLAVYSEGDNQLITTTATIDLREYVQVYDDVLLAGTLYISQLDNTLEIGNYFLKLSLQTPSAVIELLYAPITVVDNPARMRVSPISGSVLSEEEMRYHIRNLIPPGVKHGFRVTNGVDNMHFNLTRGILYTKEGYKIDTTENLNAFTLQPSTLERVDAICIFFNPDSQDNNRGMITPEYRVIKGIEDGNSIPPTIPPYHTLVKYALLRANTTTSSQVEFFGESVVAGQRPMYNVPAQQIGDGTTDIFDFSIKFIPESTEGKVDGVPQYVNVDYSEIETVEGYTSIQFIGEVPEAGQRVALSGTVATGPFYDHDYTPYNVPSSTPPVSPSYDRSDLVVELVGDNYARGEWVDSAGLMNNFVAVDAAPVKGWDGTSGSYVYFSGTEASLVCSNASNVLNSSFSIVLDADFSELPQSSNWMRMLTKGTDMTVYFINGTDPAFIVDYFGSRLRLDILRVYIDAANYVFGITYNSSTEMLTLSYGSATIQLNVSEGAFTSENWVIGNESPAQLNTGLVGKLFKVLMYNNRVLSVAELSNI